MGPEKILTLFPITLNEENLTCSNMWLVPILRKYIRGASLHFFMEHIAPVMTSLTSKCKKGILEVISVHKFFCIFQYSEFFLFYIFS